jgi:hypothetical protein
MTFRKKDQPIGPRRHGKSEPVGGTRGTTPEGQPKTGYHSTDLSKPGEGGAPNTAIAGEHEDNFPNRSRTVVRDRGIKTKRTDTVKPVRKG